MKLLSRKELLELTGYRSPVSLDNLERKGLLPPRIRVGPNRVGWDEDAIRRWLESRGRGINASAKPA